MASIPNHEMCLRIWIAIVALMALGNTFTCFVGSPNFLKSNLYNGTPNQGTYFQFHFQFLLSFSLLDTRQTLVKLVKFVSLRLPYHCQGGAIAQW